MLRERGHGAEKVPVFSSNFAPYEVDFSELALKKGAHLAHVDAPLVGWPTCHGSIPRRFLKMGSCFITALTASTTSTTTTTP